MTNCSRARTPNEDQAGIVESSRLHSASSKRHYAHIIGKKPDTANPTSVDGISGNVSMFVDARGNGLLVSIGRCGDFFDDSGQKLISILV